MTRIASTRAARFALATVIGLAIAAWTGEPLRADPAPVVSTAAPGAAAGPAAR